MAGLAIEEMLELWASSLRDVKERLRPLFKQHRSAQSAGAFLDGLLGDERRKTGWMRAEAAGDHGPWRQQAILGRGTGTRTRCATLCATMLLKRLVIREPFWLSMKLVS